MTLSLVRGRSKKFELVLNPKARENPLFEANSIPECLAFVRGMNVARPEGSKPIIVETKIARSSR